MGAEAESYLCPVNIPYPNMSVCSLKNLFMVFMRFLIFFGLTFHNFMANCSPTFVEKLRWCLVPTQPLAYAFSKISHELPEMVQDMTEIFEAEEGDQK